MRLWGFAPETPLDEGLAVLGGEGVRHRRALLHVLLWVEPLFLQWAMLLHYYLEGLKKQPPPNFQNPSPT